MSDVYPEHDKLRAIADKSQVVGEFVEWLGTKGIHLANYPYKGRLCDACQERFDDNELHTSGDGTIPHEDDIAWCQQQHIRHELLTIHTPTTSLLAEFFGIDQKRIDAEKDAMLAALRSV